MKKRIFKAVALAFVTSLVAGVGYAETISVQQRGAQTEGHVDCTTTSGTLLAASGSRLATAFHVTSGTGTVYVHSGTEAATSLNSFALQQGGPTSAHNDDNGITVYTGAWTCLAKSGTVTVFYKTIP